MKRRNRILKGLISTVLCIVLMLACIPVSTFNAFAAETAADYYEKIVDANTMNNWQKYFELDESKLDTSNAGGVWTDKSVFSNADAFPNSVSMINEGENFLTALSAIAANKEVVGYSTVPTDTVFILDLSNSMSSGDVDDLVDATNKAIADLQAINKNNRVGVVLYSGASANRTYDNAVASLLPIDRYTTTNQDGEYIQYSGSTVRLAQSRNSIQVSGTKGLIQSESKSHGGATYIQAGLWEAYKMFDAIPDDEIQIGDNNWQKDKYRMPIVVLMSDGAPTLGTSYFDDVENSTYGIGNQNASKSNVGDGNDTGITAGQGFLVQLTASYIKNNIENKYRIHDEDGAGRSLFYTLGFNISADNDNQIEPGDVAYSVLNPDASTITDSLWATYNRANTTSMQVTVEGRNSGNSNVTITKNSYATSKSYVDEYFPASGDGLDQAFEEIVEEIILQSRYYPTHLEGGSPDFSGYVEFEDTLGEYMEVKHINGILLGDTLFDGHMMASKIADNTGDGLGTVENPTELGHEFIRAVKTRLGIASTTEAQVLVANAFAAGQLRYNSKTDWSNYIGWYAKADGTYAGFWDENSTTAAPAGAVYSMKSYGFLGETTGSIKNSDMMYMSVQVRTNISTGQQTLLWKIPAALVPMITYLVTLEGTNVDYATNVQVSVENVNDVSPIRLVFESGLRSDLNELNITRITDEKHISEDGITRQFWTNYFYVDSAVSHDEHITTTAEFTPSKENERFYYTFDSAVYKAYTGNDAATNPDVEIDANGKAYILVKDNETLNQNGEYYHRRYIFKNFERQADRKPIFLYERMSAASVGEAKWDGTFVTRTQRIGAYVVPAGTPARELQMYDEQKSANPTNSAKMVFHPYISEQNDFVYVDMNLGNNGLLEVTPAQGIKLSKTVDIYEAGTSTDFRFRITVHNANGTPYTGTLNSYITDLDVVPLGEATEITLSAAGTYAVNLSAGKTLWLTGIPTGATYSIEEISINDDYKIKSVHVNGNSTGTVATGTVAAYYIDDVDFVNTAVGEGDLVITKQVIDSNSNPVDINDDITFTAQVELKNAQNLPVSGRFVSSDQSGYTTVDANGRFTITLTEGESFVLRGVPEETRYTVTETNIPNGFSYNGARSSMQGIIDATANDQAVIVNNYEPTLVNGQNVEIDVTKLLTGNRGWLDGESYSFEIRPVISERALGTPIEQFTIDYADVDKKYTLDLSGEDYSAAGTYRYVITEISGNQGGVTYDTAERRFAVVVADEGMDGDLEITAVNNEANTTVTKSGNNYTVAASFNNVYAATGSATATINIQKAFPAGQSHSLSGYQFALYDADPTTDVNANKVASSGLTNTAGQTSISLTYAANRATVEGVTYTYYLAETNAGQIINNIKYTNKVYKVEVTLKDNKDGTVSATHQISGLEQGTTVPTFTNEYIPSTSDFVTISGTKTISTGNRAINANEFEFELIAVTQGAPMPANARVKNSANGSFAFGAIEFKDEHKGKTYTYTVKEVNTNIGGFTYDDTVYTVTVIVTDNGGNITATAVVDTDATKDIVFDNKYDPEDAKVTLSGTKLLTGKELQDGEFEFVLTPTGTTTFPAGYVDTVKNKGAAFTFAEITYDKAGVYTYTVTEKGTDDANYDYDESIYAITVTVTDNSEGRLSARVQRTKDNMPSTEIVFRNGFVPTPISFDISGEFGGTKNLNGAKPQDGDFEFKLMNASNGQQIGDIVTTTNGRFAFPAVTLPDEGEYHFRISEVAGTAKGVTYDTAIYHIFVKVVKAGNGKLSVSESRLYKGTVTKEEVGGVLTEVVNYENITGNGQIEFNNSYKADPAYVTLEAIKTLTGRDLVDGEFKFDLHKTQGDYVYNDDTLIQDNVVLVLNANGQGDITFMPLMFDTQGTYNYVIIEDEIASKGVTPDKTEYKVEITVTDNNEGNLLAAVKVNGTLISGTTANTVTFNNTYTVESTEIVIKGTKTLNGRDLKAEEFSFELCGSDGQKLETVKNAADGSFIFTAIPIEEAGKYVYTVREVKGSETGITYDDSVYTVTATVTDNLDGTFKVSYAYTKGGKAVSGADFVNEFAIEVDPPKTGDNSSLWLWIALLFISGSSTVTLGVVGKKKKA